MRRSEVKRAFKEFQHLQSIVDGGGLEHEENVRVHVKLGELVKVLRDQVEAYRQAGHELLSVEEQQALMRSSVRACCQHHTYERAQEYTPSQVLERGLEIPQ